MTTKRLKPIVWGLGIATAVAMLLTLYLGLVWSPPERTMGDTIRILYFHAPSAWASYLAIGVVAIASILYLWRRTHIWDVFALASAEIGVLFTTITLISGMLWGKLEWGTYWTWDARLTSFLIMWLIYVGYLMLRAAIDDPERRARLAAIVGIVGVLDIPIIHFAVLWWRTLHPQPIVVRPGGPAMSEPMVVALMAGMLSFTLLYLFLMALRVALEIERDRAEVAAPRQPVTAEAQPG